MLGNQLISTNICMNALCQPSLPALIDNFTPQPLVCLKYAHHWLPKKQEEHSLTLRLHMPLGDTITDPCLLYTVHSFWPNLNLH